MGFPVRMRGIGSEPTYYDNSPFCVGYRNGTIQTLVPSPECYDLVDTGGGGELIGPLPPVPVYSTTTYGLPAGDDKWWLWLLLGGAVLWALSAEQKSASHEHAARELAWGWRQETGKGRKRRKKS